MAGERVYNKINYQTNFIATSTFAILLKAINDRGQVESEYARTTLFPQARSSAGMRYDPDIRDTHGEITLAQYQLIKYVDSDVFTLSALGKRFLELFDDSFCVKPNNTYNYVSTMLDVLFAWKDNKYGRRINVGVLLLKLLLSEKLNGYITSKEWSYVAEFSQIKSMTDFDKVIDGILDIRTNEKDIPLKKANVLLSGFSGSWQLLNKVDDKFYLKPLTKELLINKLIQQQDLLDIPVQSRDSDKENPLAASYTKNDFLKDVFLSSDEYEQIKRLLEYKKNIILQGAPGVGKTFLAKRLAYSIIGSRNDNNVELIQFHQNYSYEDFVMGYKPTENHFELTMGVFYKFCQKAAEKPNENFYFIIDEINRGNLSKIFGELLMLIENDKRGEDYSVRLAYLDTQFSVPKNVYFIGLMNTADRSLAIMDYALRRRFTFIDINPAFGKEAFRNHLISLGHSSSIAKTINERFVELNKKIADENTSGLGNGYCIGHSYFCSPLSEGQTDEEWYSDIIDFEITPLLREYWWDDKAKADECIDELKK